MMQVRPGGAQFLVASPGVQVMQPLSGDTPWWMAAGVTPVAAYAPKGAADLASSYINLANPGTNNAAPGVAPTFNAATGWTFNGTTQYLTTGIVPIAGWTYIVCFSGRTNTGNVLGITNAASAQMELRPSNTSGVVYANGGIITVTPTLDAGVICVAGNRGYRNGFVEGATISAWIGTLSDAVGTCIGARRRADLAAVDRFFGGNIQAVWIASSVLDAAANLAMYNAMAAL